MVSGDQDTTRWDTPLTLEPLDSTPGKQQRVRILTKVGSPRSLSVVPGQERKVKFHVVHSFLNSDWQEKNTGY